MDTEKIHDHKSTLMVAHRGVSGIEPENTISSFIAAANRSYFGIETDVHKTKDGKFIATHDDNAKRVSGVDIVIEETDFDTLRSLKLFDTDGVSHRCDLYMPTLKEYIAVCKRYEKIAVLELKNSFEEAEIKAIIDEISELDYLSGTIFISFDINNLHYVRKYSPEQTVQYLVMSQAGIDAFFENIAKYGYDIDAYYKLVTRELVEKCHSVGAKINVWTVDDVECAEKLIDLGVDYITTDICE